MKVTIHRKNGNDNTLIYKLFASIILKIEQQEAEGSEANAKEEYSPTSCE